MAAGHKPLTERVIGYLKHMRKAEDNLGSTISKPTKGLIIKRAPEYVTGYLENLPDTIEAEFDGEVSVVKFDPALGNTLNDAVQTCFAQARAQSPSVVLMAGIDEVFPREAEDVNATSSAVDKLVAEVADSLTNAFVLVLGFVYKKGSIHPNVYNNGVFKNI